jgi:hypothetical protein
MLMLIERGNQINRHNYAQDKVERKTVTSISNHSLGTQLPYYD